MRENERRAWTQGVRQKTRWSSLGQGCFATPATDSEDGNCNRNYRCRGVWKSMDGKVPGGRHGAGWGGCCVTIIRSGRGTLSPYTQGIRNAHTDV